MSLPRRSYDPRRVCLLPLPPLPAFIRTNKRTLGIYLSGAAFALGWWVFLDAVLLSSISMRAPPEDEPWSPPATSMGFSDWLPGLCATLGMIVVNLIDKQLLGDAGGTFAFGGGSGGGWGEGGVQWRARMFLFVGFALLAGGLAGSFTVLTVKYLVPVLPPGYEYYGVANVAQNGALMLSTILLWMSQSAEGEYEYQLHI
ncbi:UPF0220-domain-containing protein [Tilletiopsis washingtonensis]|uniref:UPF0220-domain-containing protein n=1 Tax=Tilletiopsis washingtonensis TaxID=58919 RepID=A0A316ZCU5_9BASI|nr:UPF0220-domain-containing protein [Tilletiopsis washingtonensis]PWN98063.1 UPF0220-domain-containing protein [Tilletiopsis washingtonensis]